MIRAKPRVLVKPTLDNESAKQLCKIAAVALRDSSPLTFQEAVSSFIYCWNRTESIPESEERERLARAAQ